MPLGGADWIAALVAENMRRTITPMIAYELNTPLGQQITDYNARHRGPRRWSQVERAVREVLSATKFSARHVERTIRLFGEESSFVSLIRRAWRNHHAQG